MTDLKQYVDINRHFMTTAEMAQEAGVDRQSISNILSRNKWTAISEPERLREYIQANKDRSIEHIAEKFGRTIQQVKTAANELGITLKTQAELDKPKLSFTSLLFARWDDLSRYHP